MRFLIFFINGCVFICVVEYGFCVIVLGMNFFWFVFFSSCKRYIFDGGVWGNINIVSLFNMMYSGRRVLLIWGWICVWVILM